jgi:hypothetical protein
MGWFHGFSMVFHPFFSQIRGKIMGKFKKPLDLAIKFRPDLSLGNSPWTQPRFFFRPEVNSPSVRRESIGCAAPENWSEGRHSVCGTSALDGSMAKGLGWVVPQIYKHIYTLYTQDFVLRLGRGIR